MEKHRTAQEIQEKHRKVQQSEENLKKAQGSLGNQRTAQESIEQHRKHVNIRISTKMGFHLFQFKVGPTETILKSCPQLLFVSIS